MGKVGSDASAVDNCAELKLIDSNPHSCNSHRVMPYYPQLSHEIQGACCLLGRFH